MLKPVVDGVVALIWVGINGVLYWSCARVVLRCYARESWPQCTMHTFVGVYAVIIGVGTLLGAVGLLQPHVSLVVVSIIAIVGLRSTRCATSISRPTRLLWCASDGGCNRRHLAAECICGLLLLSLVAALEWEKGLFTFPDSFDCLSYHLALPTFWRQAHNLYAPDSAYWSTPGNNELCINWLCSPFSGDFLFPLTNMPAVMLLALGSFDMACQLRLSKVSRRLVAIGVVANQVVLRYQLYNTDNDVAVAAFFVTALTYVFRYALHGRRADLLFGSAALGIMGGMKYYAIGYAGIAFGIAIALACIGRGCRMAAFVGCHALLGALLMGGYWYTRNVIVSGSPFYPLGGTLLGNESETRGGSFYPALWQSTLVGNGSTELCILTSEAVWRLMGPFHWIAFAGLPAAIVLMGVYRLSPHHKRRSQAITSIRKALALATVLSFSVWLVTPFAAESVPGTLNQLRYQYCPMRYGLSFFSLATVCSCTGLECAVCIGMVSACRLSAMLSKRSVASANKAWYVLPLAPTLAVIVEMRNAVLDVIADALPVCLTLFFIAIDVGVVLWLARRYRRLLLGVTSIMFASGVFGATVALSIKWHSGYAAHYDAWLTHGLCECLRRDAGDSVICVFDRRCYPFFGADRRIHVVQITGRKDMDWLTQTIRDKAATLIVFSSDEHVAINRDVLAERLGAEADFTELVNILPWPFQCFKMAPLKGTNE